MQPDLALSPTTRTAAAAPGVPVHGDCVVATPLHLAEALPRIAPTMARVQRRLYGRDAPLHTSVAGRPVSLRWRPHTTAPRGDTPRSAFGFRLGAHTGTLLIDAASERWLLDEAMASQLPPELRCVLLADALSAPVQALEAALQMRFEWVPVDAAASSHAQPAGTGFELVDPADGAVRCRGVLRLDDDGAFDALSAALVAAASPASPSASTAADARLDALSLPASFEFGRTRLSLAELRGIRRGDIVSVEDWRSTGAGIATRLVLGRVHLSSLGAVADGDRIVLDTWKDFAVTLLDRPALHETDSDAAGLPLDRLDALEVTLRFEVGDLRLPLGELRNIRAGHVFELGQPLQQSTVRILVHGNLLGSGHLVAVGDRLGVRVSEFAPDAHG